MRLILDITADFADLSEEDRVELLSTVAAHGAGRLTVKGYAFDGNVTVEGLDTSSSASRQHYIDTGRYLTPAEVAEYAS